MENFLLNIISQSHIFVGPFVTFTYITTYSRNFFESKRWSEWHRIQNVHYVLHCWNSDSLPPW